MLSNADILVTGGTGSFGRALVTRLLGLRDPGPRRIIVYSRDELKQYEMQRELRDFDEMERLRFFLGDVRDGERLRRALTGVDYVVHAAALKQVPACEYNPQEAMKTNIGGAQNLIEAAIDMGVQRVVALSTDKACSPVNLYGATKLVAEKMFTAAGAISGALPTRFAVVRYGNVIGSRGSVVPLFRKQVAAGKELTITDSRMTRFWITLPQAVDFVLRCLERMAGGEIFVPALPTVDIMTLADAIAGAGYERCIVGIRQGEKLHETLITAEESWDTFSPEPGLYVVSRARMEEAIGRAETVVRPMGAYTSESKSWRLGLADVCEMLKEVPA